MDALIAMVLAEDYVVHWDIFAYFAGTGGGQDELVVSVNIIGVPMETSWGEGLAKPGQSGR